MLGKCKYDSVSDLVIEILLFSDKIKKINMYSWVQERYLIITNEKIYNVKKTRIKRTIQVTTTIVNVMID